MRLLTWAEYVRLALSYAQYAQNDDGSFTVEIPVLAGCVTWGQTRAEAALMAEDAVQGWLVTSLRFGDEIPAIEDNALAYVSDWKAPVDTTRAEA
jgi:predicted RNase H-like HicB family nuclease